MKRWICLFLVLVGLCAALAPVAGAAQPFTDLAAVQNADEITMLVDLGLLSGYSDGSFRPKAVISRQEIAKICSILTGDLTESAQNPFSDVSYGTWGRDYILDCYAKGIVTGGSDARFRPHDTVTAQELAKMLLACIGYDTSAYVGSDWGTKVDTAAAALGLYRGYYYSTTMPLTRNDAGLMVYNALQCDAVARMEGNQPVYYLDDLMNPQTLLEHRFGIVRYEQLLTANEYADLTTEGGRLETGMTKIEHHRVFAVSTDLDMIGRYVVIYAVGDEVVGAPARSMAEVYYTFRSDMEYTALLSKVSYQTSPDTQYYINYDAATADQVNALTDHSMITMIDHTNDGVIDIVLAVTYEEYPYGEIAEQVTNPPAVTPADDQLVRAAEIGGGYYLLPEG